MTPGWTSIVCPARRTRARLVQKREPVELTLRAPFLDYPDERVCDQHAAEERIWTAETDSTPSTTAQSVPSSALMRLNTLARTISPKLRLVRRRTRSTARRPRALGHLGEAQAVGKIRHRRLPSHWPFPVSDYTAAVSGSASSSRSKRP
ncbi:hypothetical protein [Pandoraea sp. XY-2]|uniref:hypothetical protein n=1 Tax=Pandoraea sp. XY-2 TaxID=2518599 RepID=UPI001F109D8F|nr:hypothetical protein [Pandoraea sp. XY-2]